MELKSSVISGKIRTFTGFILESKLTWILSFSVLTAISAQVSIPVKPIPITLQTMTVVLAGAFLGAKKGAYSQLLYLFFGIIGFPVFAYYPDAPVGIARLLGPTGGYLIAFPLAAFLTGLILEKNKNYLVTVLAMFSGELLILLFGTLYLDLFFIKNIELSIMSGAAIFSVWTVVKVFTAAALFSGIKRNSARK